MSIRTVYSTSTVDGPAGVSAFIHDDGTKSVMLCPSATNGVGVTLNLHWSPAEARRVAEMLVAAADAVEADGVTAGVAR